MKNLRKSALALSLAAGTMFSASAFAADTDANAQQPMETIDVITIQENAQTEPPLVRLAHQLDLTDQQRQKIKDIAEKARPQFKKIMESMANNGKNLRDALKNKDFDQAKIQKLADEQGKNVSKLVMAQAMLEHNIMGVLTDAQKQKLHDMMMQADNNS